MIYRLLSLLLIFTLIAPACAPGSHADQGADAGAVDSEYAISNVLPRKDTDGNVVDAHDGRVIQFGDHFYWYGTRYGTTNGFTTANEYHVYRSPDLQNWEHLGALLPDAPEGVYYRPHVIFSEASGKYVLWYNWYPELWDGHFGVATSDTPEGPFTIVSTDVRVKNSALGVGDFGLFVDDDQTAYISYNTIDGHRVSIEKLTDDYLGSTLENGGYIAQYCEAGSMFKRNGVYYLLTDYTCCFCNQGAGARVYLSDDPLGDWTLTNNINRRPGRRIADLTDGETYTTQYVPLNRVNDTTYQQLYLEYDEPTSTIEIAQFTGDRSGQCGQVDNPRVHQMIEDALYDYDYYDHGWKPLPRGKLTLNRSAMATDFREEVTTPITGLLRLTPRADYPYDQIRLTETNADRAYISGPGPGPIIIPAQQAYVMELETESGTDFIWMGDLWGSATDNVKGHDFQYWSSPLQFDSLGWIEPLTFETEWSL